MWPFLIVLFSLLCLSLLVIEFRRGRGSAVFPNDGAASAVSHITFGGYLVIFSCCIAIASLGLGWADAFFFMARLHSLTGWALGMVVTIVIWIYPTRAAFNGIPIRLKTIAIYSVVGSIITAIIWVKIDGTKKFFVIDVDPGVGMYVFVFAGIIMTMGMLLDFLQHKIRILMTP